MKKLLFAAQVFGLIAAFPIVVFLEMNHATPSENNISSDIIQSTESTITCPPEKTKDRMVNEVFIVTLGLPWEKVYQLK